DKILSFRSTDPHFKPDPGVIPDDEMCIKAGITVVKTGFQHNELSDRGSDRVKSTIQSLVHKFLDDDGSLKLGQIKSDDPDVNPIDPFAMVTASVPR
ncbi:MAG: alpha/beta hydrolase, partial [Bradyrhizobium sp.]